MSTNEEVIKMGLGNQISDPEVREQIIRIVNKPYHKKNVKKKKVEDTDNAE